MMVAASDSDVAAVGVVVIGRNEGDRLIRAIDAIRRQSERVVYVDSGSTDDSVTAARKRGCEVVDLDLSTPFTAARARNAGFTRLLEAGGMPAAVQFVDGDCEVADGWLAAGASFLAEHKCVAVVSGRLRERHPEASIWNRLCDLEWDTPIGPAQSCGGNAMFRAAVFDSVGRFDAGLIAGEEPELCVRIRAAGHAIHRIDHPMAMHDAAMTSVRQWWKRSVRAGHAFAEGRHLHGAPPERFRVREIRSIIAWTLAIPFAAGITGALVGWMLTRHVGMTIIAAVAAILLVYAMQWFRMTRRRRPRPYPGTYSFFALVGKFAELIGVMKFNFNRMRGRQSRIIEYKHDHVTDEPVSGGGSG